MMAGAAVHLTVALIAGQASPPPTKTAEEIIRLSQQRRTNARSKYIQMLKAMPCYLDGRKAPRSPRACLLQRGPRPGSPIFLQREQQIKGGRRTTKESCATCGQWTELSLAARNAKLLTVGNRSILDKGEPPVDSLARSAV